MKICPMFVFLIQLFPVCMVHGWWVDQTGQWSVKCQDTGHHSLPDLDIGVLEIPGN